MAATRLIPMHVNKGKTLAQSLGDRTDYAKNPEKTDKGELVTGYQCDPMTVDEEFMLSKRQYEQITGRRQKHVFNPSKQEEYFAWMIDKCDELSNALVQVGEMDEEAQEKDKFTKLKQYLENCGKTELILTFADIEAIIGCTLCKSAYNYSAYWNPSPTHTMPNTILSAGYKIVSVDLISKELVMQKQ